MKVLCVFLTVTIALSQDLVVGETEQETKILKACQEKTKASKSAIEKVQKMDTLEDSKEAKCFVWCILDSFGAIKEDGTIINEVAEKYFKENFGDKAEKAHELWTSCQEKEEVVSAKGDDLCHYSFTLLQCFHGDLKKEQIKLGSR